MSCFIHKNKDGVASCIKCGKNMCVDCSSLTGHSGLCPTCELPILKLSLEEQNKEKTKLIVSAAVIGIIAFIICIGAISVNPTAVNVLISIAVFLGIGGIVALGAMLQIRKVMKKINELEDKIAKIEKALSEGSRSI